jgi:hypothetical protein
VVADEKSTTNSSEEKTFGNEPSETDTPMPITLVPESQGLSERSSAAAAAAAATGVPGAFTVVMAVVATVVSVAL